MLRNYRRNSDTRFYFRKLKQERKILLIICLQGFTYPPFCGGLCYTLIYITDGNIWIKEAPYIIFLITCSVASSSDPAASYIVNSDTHVLNMFPIILLFLSRNKVLFSILFRNISNLISSFCCYSRRTLWSRPQGRILYWFVSMTNEC